MTDWNQLKELYLHTSKTFGKPSLVCNGAGVYEPPWSNFWTNTEKATYKTIDINLTSAIKSTRHAITYMAKDGGTILNVASIAGQVPLFATPIYNASKFGLVGFTRSLATLDKELGIRVVAANPGVVKTPLWTEHPEKMAFRSEEDDWITPEECAQSMLDLAENEKYVGGSIMEILKGRSRLIPLHDEDMPSGPGATVHNIGQVEQEILEKLKQEEPEE